MVNVDATPIRLPAAFLVSAVGLFGEGKVLVVADGSAVSAVTTGPLQVAAVVASPPFWQFGFPSVGAAHHTQAADVHVDTVVKDEQSAEQKTLAVQNPEHQWQPSKLASHPASVA